MSETKTFHIGDILSIVSGKLVSPNHIGGVYDICDWMTDSKNMTHQLPRVSREIEPQLRADFPDLAAIEVPSTIDSEESCLAYLATLYPVYGETRQVGRLQDEADHTSIDPIAEIKMISPDATVIEL